MAEFQELTRGTLRGEIRHVVFQSEDGVFAILRIVDGDGVEHTVRGPVGGLAAGQNIEVEGYWERHAEFGRQFRAESCRIRLPSTPEGIKRFLENTDSVGMISIQAVSSEIADGRLKVIEIDDFICEREFCFVQNAGQSGGLESDFMRYITRKF